MNATEHLDLIKGLQARIAASVAVASKPAADDGWDELMGGEPVARPMITQVAVTFFERIAKPLAEMNIPVTPVRPGTKKAFLPDFPTTATTDLNQIAEWGKQYSDCNVACVARAEEGGIWLFEVDSKDVIPRLESETGQKMPDTFRVRSRPGRGHYYFRHNDASMNLPNLSQTYVQHQDWSVRTNREYVVGPGSTLPDREKPYEALNWGTEIAEAPQWLIDWLLSQKIQKTASEKVEAPRNERGLVPRGSIHGFMLSQAGRMRNAGLNQDEIEVALLRIVHEQCEPPIDDEKVKAMAKSICQYEPGEVPKSLALNQTPTQPTGRTLNFVRGNSVKPVRLKWLWAGRILANKLNVFSGEPDVGKGMTTVDFAARITRHLDFPDSKNELDGPKDVLFLSSEDDMEDTIIPRLIVAGADMSRIHFAEISENSSGTLSEGIVCLDQDLPVLEEAVKRHPDIVLIIPDPVIAFLGDADPNKDKEVRPIYSKMKSFAKRLDVGWLFVNHWNKNQNATSINRTSGAKTMVSAPRATWMFCKSPEDPSRYLMMKGKGNLSSTSGTKTLAYRIVGVPYDFQDGKPEGEVPKLVWDGETDHSTESVLQTQADPTSRRNSKAEVLLEKLLESGAMRAKDVYRAADKEALDSNQMKRARYKLGYVADQIGGVWYWAKLEKEIQAEMGRQIKASSISLNQDSATV